MTTNVMRSQLSRLYGQLYAFQVGKATYNSYPVCLSSGILCTRALSAYTEVSMWCWTSTCCCCCGLVQGKAQEALKAFAEDVYYCSLEYGPQDARTSLGYYNLSKVLQTLGNLQVTA